MEDASLNEKLKLIAGAEEHQRENTGIPVISFERSAVRSAKRWRRLRFDGLVSANS
eukprot:SAG11_NODE_510_length_8851_cov_25.360718_4_plen_56_part_00